jgi:transcriptional regulator with XRE-family HTH domain
MKENKVSTNKDHTPDLIVDGVEYEVKVTRGRPAAVGPNASPRVIRRSSASRAQWFCAANPDSPRMADFAREIRRVRLARDWSQAEAAEKCSMNQSHWSNLETAQIEPLPEKVFELERNLGVKPGTLSRHLGYSPATSNDRELFTLVAEKLEYLHAHGAWAVEEVLKFDNDDGNVQNFLNDAEVIGIDVIAALAKLSNDLLSELNKAVDEAMPKLFRMKQAEMKNLSSRLISLTENVPQADYNYDELVNEARRENPNLDIS